MENWLYSNAPTLLKSIASLIAIFTVVIIITRIAGLRTFAKMSSFDFASTIAVGSILATVVMSTDNSILKGALALAGIIAFQAVFSYLVRKWDWLRNLFTNKPMMLMYKGEILDKNLDKTNVGRNDLIAKLREANVHQFDEVEAVILESTGDMSVLHSNDNRNLDSSLIEGVRGMSEML